MQLIDKTNYMKRISQTVKHVAQKSAVIVIILAIGIISFEFIFGESLNNWLKNNSEVIYQTEVINQKEQRIDEIRNSVEFKNKVDAELEKMYLKEQIKSDQERLLEIQDAGFSGEQVSALRNFLKDYDSELAMYAEEIVKFPRWVEAVAITGKETSFCNAGVGSSRNNCGAIKNSRTGEFKVYANKMDAVEDISILLQKDAYKDKSIAEMNGLYCQDAQNSGNQCDNWTEVIEKYIGKLQLAMLN